MFPFSNQNGVIYTKNLFPLEILIELDRQIDNDLHRFCGGVSMSLIELGKFETQNLFPWSFFYFKSSQLIKCSIAKSISQYTD